MAFDRRYLRAFWFTRISLLIAILGLLSSAYVHTFVSSNTLKSYGSIVVALSLSMLFFATIPGHRLDIRYSQLEKKLSEITGVADTSPTEASSKDEVRSLWRFTITLIIYTVFVLINILFAAAAYSDHNRRWMFTHMVVIVAASFLYDASLLTYRVDQTFTKIEGLISECSKDRQK